MVAIVAAAISCWLFWDRAPKGNQVVAEQVPSLLPEKARNLANSSGFPTPKEPHASTPPLPIGPGKIFVDAKEWLDEFCPKLTLEEEERLLAEYGRTPMVLIALASMNRERAKIHLEEALATYPDDPDVLLTAYSYRNNLEIDGIQLLERLKEARPDDAFPHFVLARKLLTDGDKVSAENELLQAYNKKVFSPSLAESLRQQEIQLLTSADRTRDQALARATANRPNFGGGVGNIFAHVGGLTSDEAFGEAPQKLAALLIDVSQQMQQGSSVDQANFRLQQEKQLLDKFAQAEEAGTNVIGFPKPPAILAQEVQAEVDALQPHSRQSQRFVPMMQALDDKARSEFLNVFDQEGELAAIQWVEQQRPEVYQNTQKGDSGPWPSGGFWD